MTRAEDVLFEVGNQGESHTVEFKESLTTSARRNAIEAMVAFANSEGGWVFFGVTNDRFLKGVQIGGNTLEKLAVEIRDHIYPSLPVVIEAIPGRDRRKHIVAVEVPVDVPPVIGVYVYSAKAIPPNKPVDTSEVQAYRRVGRMNQKENFMRLRQPQPSDPKLRVRATTSRGTYYANDQSLASFACFVWAEEGSATAHGIRVFLNPGKFVSYKMIEDLPYLGIHGFNGIERVYVEHVPVRMLLDVTEISSIYLDDWGIKWRVSRGIRVTAAEEDRERWLDVEDRGLFTRRIVEFPPKVSVT